MVLFLQCSGTSQPSGPRSSVPGCLNSAQCLKRWTPQVRRTPRAQHTTVPVTFRPQVELHLRLCLKALTWREVWEPKKESLVTDAVFGVIPTFYNTQLICLSISSNPIFLTWLFYLHERFRPWSPEATCFSSAAGPNFQFLGKFVTIG